MKPTKTRWATGDPTYIIQPSASKMDIGWLAGEKPPRQFMNWLFNLIYNWETYYEDKTENIDHLVLRSVGAITWDGGTGTLTFGSAIDIVFRVTTTSHINRIPAGSLVIADGQVVVVARNRGGVSPVSIAQGAYPGLNVGEYDIINDSSLVATNQENELILFRNFGGVLEIPPLGATFQSGIILNVSNSNSSYKHTQGVGATTWTVAHNLNNVDHIVQVFDASNILIQPDTITRGANSDTITFASSQTGSALLISI